MTMMIIYLLHPGNTEDGCRNDCDVYSECTGDDTILMVMTVMTDDNDNIGTWW